MCVQPVAWPEPDPLIAAAIAAKYPGKRPRPLAVQVRDRLGQWLADEDFAAAFGTRPAGMVPVAAGAPATRSKVSRVPFSFGEMFKDIGGRYRRELPGSCIQQGTVVALLDPVQARGLG